MKRNELVMSGCSSQNGLSGSNAARAADKYLTRMKSPREKLLVISASRLRLQ